MEESAATQPPRVPSLHHVAGRVLYVGPDDRRCGRVEDALGPSGLDVDVTSHLTPVFRVVVGTSRRYGVLLVDRHEDELSLDELARRLRRSQPDVALAFVTQTIDVRSTPFDAWLQRPYELASLADFVRSAVIARERRQGRSTKF